MKLDYTNGIQLFFEKLHQTYMKHFNSKDLTMSVLNYLHDKKSSLFEFYNLLYKFKIIRENNANSDENFLRITRAWRQLLKCIWVQKNKN